MAPRNGSRTPWRMRRSASWLSTMRSTVCQVLVCSAWHLSELSSTSRRAAKGRCWQEEKPDASSWPASGAVPVASGLGVVGARVWKYLAFWGVSGVLLVALLPWFDRVWEDSFGGEPVDNLVVTGVWSARVGVSLGALKVMAVITLGEDWEPIQQQDKLCTHMSDGNGMDTI